MDPVAFFIIEPKRSCDAISKQYSEIVIPSSCHGERCSRIHLAVYDYQDHYKTMNTVIWGGTRHVYSIHQPGPLHAAFHSRRPTRL